MTMAVREGGVLELRPGRTGCSGSPTRAGQTKTGGSPGGAPVSTAPAADALRGAVDEREQEQVFGRAHCPRLEVLLAAFAPRESSKSVRSFRHSGLAQLLERARAFARSTTAASCRLSVWIAAVRRGAASSAPGPARTTAVAARTMRTPDADGRTERGHRRLLLGSRLARRDPLPCSLEDARLGSRKSSGTPEDFPRLSRAGLCGLAFGDFVLDTATRQLLRERAGAAPRAQGLRAAGPPPAAAAGGRGQGGDPGAALAGHVRLGVQPDRAGSADPAGASGTTATSAAVHADRPRVRLRVRGEVRDGATAASARRPKVDLGGAGPPAGAGREPTGARREAAVRIDVRESHVVTRDRGRRTGRSRSRTSGARTGLSWRTSAGGAGSLCRTATRSAWAGSSWSIAL